MEPEVGLVVDPPARRQQIDQPSVTDQLVGEVAGPRLEGLVDLDDRAVGGRGEIAARRLLVQRGRIVVEESLLERWVACAGRHSAISGQERLHGPDDLVRGAEVRTVTARVQHGQGAVRDGSRDVLPHVIGAIMSSRDCMTNVGTETPGQVRPVVGEERGPREPLRDVRVGAAEALGELLTELRAVQRCP